MGHVTIGLAAYSLLYWLSIRINHLPCTVVMIRCLKDFGVKILTFWSHVTSVTVTYDHWMHSVCWSFETITLSHMIAEILYVKHLAKHIPN